ncbi:SDR family NAD(P)-dependent oxidoreductase, partial [Burkholderia contaminans]
CVLGCDAGLGAGTGRGVGAVQGSAGRGGGAGGGRQVRGGVAVPGGVDVVVNKAGVSRGVPNDALAAATPDGGREMHEINVIAPFRLVAEAEAALREAASHGRAGCVVNVSSHAGVRPKGASIPYAAAKAALNHTTRLLAKTLAPAIRVNAVAPGLVDTPLTADW